MGRMVRVNVLNDAFKSMYKAKKGGKRQVMTDHPLKLSLSFSWLCKSMVPSVSFSMSTITELEIEDWTARLLLSRQVMCNGCTPAREPIPTNKRHNAAKIFSQPNVIAEESWYDIEQEYSLMHKDINCPLGWPVGGCVGSQLSKDALWCWCRQNLGMRHNPFSLQDQIANHHNLYIVDFTAARYNLKSLFVILTWNRHCCSSFTKLSPVHS